MITREQLDAWRLPAGPLEAPVEAVPNRARTKWHTTWCHHRDTQTAVEQVCALDVPWCGSCNPFIRGAAFSYDLLLHQVAQTEDLLQLRPQWRDLARVESLLWEPDLQWDAPRTGTEATEEDLACVAEVLQAHRELRTAVARALEDARALAPDPTDLLAPAARARAAADSIPVRDAVYACVAPTRPRYFSPYSEQASIVSIIDALVTAWSSGGVDAMRMTALELLGNRDVMNLDALPQPAMTSAAGHRSPAAWARAELDALVQRQVLVLDGLLHDLDRQRQATSAGDALVAYVCPPAAQMKHMSEAMTALAVYPPVDSAPALDTVSRVVVRRIPQQLADYLTGDSTNGTWMTRPASADPCDDPALSASMLRALTVDPRWPASGVSEEVKHARKNATRYDPWDTWAPAGGTRVLRPSERDLLGSRRSVKSFTVLLNPNGTEAVYQWSENVRVDADSRMALVFADGVQARVSDDGRVIHLDRLAVPVSQVVCLRYEG